MTTGAPTEPQLPAHLAFAARYPFALDDFQLQAMEALTHGKSVLVAAPTGTGKTVVAEFGVDQALSAGLRAFYTTPIKALSNQKFRDFQLIYGDKVGLVTGDLTVNPDGRLLVMTTEVLRNMFIQSGSAPADLGIVIFDEVHYVGDLQRGTAWEEAILLAPPHLPFVCLSATVPNAAEVASWIRSSHGDLVCIEHHERAVPLEHFYFVDGKAIRLIGIDGRRAEQIPKLGGELAGRVRFGSLPQAELAGRREPRPQVEPADVVRYLEKNKLTPAIYFLFGRRACEQSAQACLLLPPVPHAKEMVREAQARLSDLPPEDRRLRQVTLLIHLLSRGVAVHHAGLLPVIKILVEEFFASGRLRAVFATDTLALGINMPARTVVIGEMLKFDGESRRLLTPNEYRQMIGRAGRRGIDERGVAMMIYSPWVRAQDALEIADGELLPLESAFQPTYSTAANLWREPGDEERLADLYARSLRRFQHDVVLEQLADEYEQTQARFQERAERTPGDPRVWADAHELAAIEDRRRFAQHRARTESRKVVQGLGRVMERFGYLSVRRPTWKAELLRNIFDSNALTLAELLNARLLNGLDPAEIAEVCSWFTWDRESPIRALPISPRLYRLREQLSRMHGDVLHEEQRAGLAISRPLPLDFQGVALAWAEGSSLSDIAQRSRIAEGDLVGLLQKTLDLLSQLKVAASRAARPGGQKGPVGIDERLLERIDAADQLLRRGVVEASYRWAVSGLPDPEDGETWDVPPLDDRAGDQAQKPRRRHPGPPRRNGPPRRRRGQ
ncbi:MAG: DEAD/DEAH box helicase [Chloroflexota bacterium]